MKKSLRILSTLSLKLAIAGMLVLGSCRMGQMPITAQSADLLYSKQHYHTAAGMYAKLLKKEKDPEMARKQTLKLAECYRQMNDYPRAVEWYAQVVGLYPNMPAHRLTYANLLMSTNSYQAAVNELKIYQKEVPGDKSAAEKIAMCQKALELDASKGRFSVRPIDALNTEYNEYAPFLANGNLYFTSDRAGSTGGLKYPRLGTYYSDVYVSERMDNGVYGRSKVMEGPLNTPHNEGTLVFDASGRSAVFTRCGHAGADSSCQLMVALHQDGTWSEPKPLDFNWGQGFMLGQPSLSNNGLSLVFSSNAPGGFGGQDLYISTLQNNTWSKPENMGSTINTSKDEMFPSWFDDHTLYFSSNGHPGFGALDLFVSYYKGNKWRKPTNLLPPINSGGDDMTLHFDAASDGKSGYLSSNRLGRGDDIFAFEIQTPSPSTLCGTVYDHKTKKPLPRARVLLYDRMAESRYYVETDDKGQYCIQIPFEKEYRLDAYNQYYTNKNEPAYLSTVGLAFSQRFEQDFYLTKWTVDEVKIEGILYDLDKADLRPESKVVLDSLGQLLKLHYYLVVELSSHTDCRGTGTYNETLSQRRAESCVDYLTAMGIDPSRLEAKGYGEGRLLNDCACEDDLGTGLGCSEAQHQANRRTSFQIMRTDFEPQDLPDFGLPWPLPEE